MAQASNPRQFLHFFNRDLLMRAQFDGKTQAVRGSLIAELEELHRWAVERAKALRDEKLKISLQPKGALTSYVHKPFNECEKLILVMNVSTWFFSETNHKKQLKLCGNCKLAEFGLSDEDTAFPVEIIGGYNLKNIRTWIGRDKIKKAGPTGAVDPKKTRISHIIQNHLAYCEAEKTWVSFVDEHCFKWQPREPPLPITRVTYSYQYP